VKTLKQGLKVVANAIVLSVLCVPLAVVVTLVTAPFWLWIEETCAIEAYGHSGPANWCYLAVYLVLLAACAVIAWPPRLPGRGRSTSR
jgi:hypothetical protein